MLLTVEVPVAKLSFLAGFGAGYVLGARAGRERYEQIRRAWEHAKDDPRLQGVAGMAQARADAVVASVRARTSRSRPGCYSGPGAARSVSRTPHLIRSGWPQPGGDATSPPPTMAAEAFGTRHDSSA